MPRGALSVLHTHGRQSSASERDRLTSLRVSLGWLEVLRLASQFAGLVSSGPISFLRNKAPSRNTMQYTGARRADLQMRERIAKRKKGLLNKMIVDYDSRVETSSFLVRAERGGWEGIIVRGTRFFLCVSRLIRAKSARGPS